MIEDLATFRDAKFLVQITKLLAEADAIALLESHSAHLGNVLETLFNIQKYYDQIREKSRFFPPKYQFLFALAEKSVNVRAEEIDLPIYVVALFVCPKYRKICVSKKYSIENISKFVLELACKGGFTEFEANQLDENEIKAYYYNWAPHHNKDRDPKTTGASLSVNHRAWRNLQVLFCQLCPLRHQLKDCFPSWGGRKRNTAIE